jgi:hypothetical protein
MNFDSMINKDGTKKYAYIMLLMIGDEYVPASIVLAESLKKIGCLADLVIMVDEQILTNELAELLKMFYDKIIPIKKIKINNKDPVQKYIITKILGLKFTEYEKVALIDVDSIILSNPNKIFEYDYPAGLYIKNVLSTGIILLKPDIQDFLNLETNAKNLSTSLSKPLVYLFEDYYKKFNPIDNRILKSNDYSDAYGIQYNVNKPFIIKSTIPIETRCKWEHFKLWFMHFRSISNDYPDISKYKSLSGAIELLKYYLAPLSRFILLNRSRYKKVKKEQIKELYGISTDKNLDYYHLNVSKESDSDDLVYLLNDLTIKSFVDYLKSKTNLFENLMITSVTNINNIIKQVDSSLILDYLLSEYIKIFPNVFVVLLINEESEHKTKLTPELKQNLFFKKEFSFMGLIIKNIMFNIYQDKVYQERILELSNYNDYTKYRVQLLLYQTIFPIQLTSNDNKKIFVINDINSKIRLGSIFFNSNTLNRYNKHQIQPIVKNQIKKKELKSILNFQSVKKWLYNIYSGNHLDNIIVIQHKPLIILDTNNYTEEEANKILNKKIDLFELIVNPSKKFNSGKDYYYKIAENINNPEYYWVYEGIKVLLDKN